MKKNSGFTLIEMSIVLVLIGLLIGGILKGQELIQSATIKSTIYQTDQLKAAWQSFVDKYNGIPGDYNDASFYISPLTPGGNGDGNLNRIDQSWWYSGPGGEMPRTYSGWYEFRHVFTHLAESGFLGTVDYSTAAFCGTNPAAWSSISYFCMRIGKINTKIRGGEFYILTDTPPYTSGGTQVGGAAQLEFGHGANGYNPRVMGFTRTGAPGDDYTSFGDNGFIDDYRNYALIAMRTGYFTTGNFNYRDMTSIIDGRMAFQIDRKYDNDDNRNGNIVHNCTDPFGKLRECKMQILIGGKL